MNFAVSSSTLLKHLQSISGVLVSNNTLPILDNFLFEISDSTLSIHASDIETTMITTLEVESNKSGSICMPSNILLDILKNLPEQPVTFRVNEETLGIELASATGNFEMVGYPGEDFPKVKELERTQQTIMTSGVLSEAINKTIFATSNDELRPVMGGVFCEISPENMTFVATDAHKLVRYRRNESKAATNASFILPKKALTLLKNNLASGDEAEISIDYNEDNALFKFRNIQLICRLIEGKYPNYEAVIPQENPNVLTIEREAFLNSIRRVSIFANKTTRQVSLKISGSELSISAEDIDFSNKANERLTCSYNGADIEIGFNSRFLIEILNNISSEEVKLMMSQPNRAGIIVPANPEDENVDILMLVMPVMINN